MSEPKIDVEVLHRALNSVAKALIVLADSLADAVKEVASCLNEAALKAAADKPGTDAANPWRYFAEFDDPEGIRRIKRGGEGTLYHKSGAVIPATRPIEWYEEDAKRPMPFCREVTEAEAAAILGGKPWEEKQ